jgi:hypothetical protein
MFPAIDNAASCKTRAVIRLLHAKVRSTAEIHSELCAVYGQNLMNEGTVRQWCRMFKDGRRIFMMKSEVDGRPSVMSDDKKNCERKRFTISEISCEFPQFSNTVLYEIITVSLGYYKFCARWLPKMLTGTHKIQRTASALIFLERYYKDGDEFRSHIF